MIDYFQAETIPPPGTDIIRQIQKIEDVFSTYSQDTGKEVVSETYLKGIVKIRQYAGKVIIGCSLHQYYNLLTSGLRHNNDLFTYDHCIIALNAIADATGTPLNRWKIKVLEYGINIPYPYDIEDLQRVEIIYRKGIGHLNFKSNRDAYYEQSKKRLKIYSKPYDGINQVRFEKRIKDNWQLKKDLQINSLQHLTDRKIWSCMKDKLIEELDKILIVDIEARGGNAEIKQIINTHDWDLLHSDVSKGNVSRPTFSKRWRKALKKTEQYGYDTKKKILKINLLEQYLKMIKPPMLDKTGFTNCTLSITAKCKPSYHPCIVTGLDISSQRNGSKYLSQNSLLKLAADEPDIYQILELKYLTHRWKSSSIKTKAYYIAHNIRNEGSRRMVRQRVKSIRERKIQAA